MRISAPIYALKRRAKLLAREKSIPLHQALDLIAAGEGFSAWSLLVSKAGEGGPAHKLLPQLAPGDLVILGARPQQGKTLLSIELAIEAMRDGRRAVFFSFELAAAEMRERIEALGAERSLFETLFTFDGSDDISAGYIAERLADAPSGAMVIIDYLQLLDQKRDTPPLMEQVQALKALASTRGLVVVLISQIDRAYDRTAKPCPDLSDVRLPNALDLSLFTKACFLHDGEIRLQDVPQRAA